MYILNIDDGTGSIGKAMTVRDMVRFLIEKDFVIGTSRIYQPDKDSYICLEEKFGKDWKNKILNLLKERDVPLEDFNFENFEIFYEDVVQYNWGE